MKKNKIIVLVAAVLLLIASVPSVLAYIFTYTEVKMDKDITLYYKEPKFNETVDGAKHLKITATEDSEYMFVRVLAITDDESREQYLIPPYSFSSEDDPATTTPNPENANNDWVYNEEDGYWYYYKPIKKGEETSSWLHIYYGELDDTQGEDNDDFHVIVLYEAVAAHFSNEEISAKSVWYDEENDGYWYSQWTDSFIVEED
ncbi:MAG: hypothetical protein IKS51_05505 [Erysipelotrichaceae bacterium]|nr:hypothetical protein [Erysipelotrichaceae bacterium]